MLRVKCECVYTETNFLGFQKRWEARFEAVGSGPEVVSALECVMDRSQLPGISNVALPASVGRQLMAKDDYE